jgi:TonB-dependent SusC/RagA subfamily outer membrane receptor
VEGTTVGTTTDLDGEFELTVPDLEETLVFTFIGYERLVIPIDGRTEINIELQSEAILGEELVVIGYGTQRRENLTGSVAVVDSEEISRRTVTNTTEALQGIAPNLNIEHTGFSSEPGGEMDINIRGIGSLTGDSSPYVLVDGVPMDLNAINPNDIESISVLKDAAASAIYGSNAPFGVILITTKQGERDDRVQVEYTGNLSFSSPIGLPHMVDSPIFATAFNQAHVNAGLSPHFSDEDIQRMERYIAGEITEETWELPGENEWAGNEIWSIQGNANNDWLHIFYKDRVPRHKHDISVRGGGSNSTYYISAGYWDQPGELRYGDQYSKGIISQLI